MGIVERAGPRHMGQNRTLEIIYAKYQQARITGQTTNEQRQPLYNIVPKHQTEIIKLINYKSTAKQDTQPNNDKTATDQHNNPDLKVTGYNRVDIRLTGIIGAHGQSGIRD